MKVTEQQLSPEVLQAALKLISQRLQNTRSLKANGTDPMDGLMADLCMVEAKMDAILMILDQKGTIDFTHFQQYLIAALDKALVNAQYIWKQMMAARGR